MSDQSDKDEALLKWIEERLHLLSTKREEMEKKLEELLDEATVVQDTQILMQEIEDYLSDK